MVSEVSKSPVQTIKSLFSTKLSVSVEVAFRGLHHRRIAARRRRIKMLFQGFLKTRVNRFFFFSGIGKE
jgi:hypothetical protein